MGMVASSTPEDMTSRTAPRAEAADVDALAVDVVPDAAGEDG